MNTADALGLQVHDPTRVVYVREGSGPCLLDSWEATTGLHRRLVGARELVLLDPLSFPYEQLTGGHRAIPVTVVLPDLPVEDVVALLGEPLLGLLTPGDLALGPTALLEHLGGQLGLARTVGLEDGEDALAVLNAHWREERTNEVEASFGPFTGHADDSVTKDVRESGAYRRSELAALLAAVRPGDRVLDVGAHVGAVAVPLAQACGPEGRLDAFEANPASVELLAENLRRNALTWASVHHAAVADGSGMPARSQLLAAGDTGAATAVRVWDGDQSGLWTVTLDDWWVEAGRPDVDVLNLDIEGAELLALRGALRMLEANHPVVQLHLSEQRLAAAGASIGSVVGLLERHGYRFLTNVLGPSRPDDEFRLEPFDPVHRGDGPVHDVLCVADDDRIPT